MALTLTAGVHNKTGKKIAINPYRFLSLASMDNQSFSELKKEEDNSSKMLFLMNKKDPENAWRPNKKHFSVQSNQAGLAWTLTGEVRKRSQLTGMLSSPMHRSKIYEMKFCPQKENNIWIHLITFEMTGQWLFLIHHVSWQILNYFFFFVKSKYM